MRDSLVSVIIPIYNVEKYLAECLDSVLAQTHSAIEVICVNDGSTDGSLSIIREYEQKDDRIVVIDKPNGGYGHSVNCGLEIATGEWISIVEPDDMIGARMYEDLLALSVMSNGEVADIVKGSYWLYFHFSDRDPYVERPNLMNCMPQGFCELNIWEEPEVMRHHPSIWSAIYRRDFVEEKHIRMIEPKGAGWADNPWLFETMLQAENIAWTPAPYYYYRQTNPDASSVLKDFHLPFDRLRDIRAIYDRMGITNKGLLQALYLRSFNYICSSLLEEFGFPEKDPEMQALIREVFESFDKKLVLEKNNGIPTGRKNYYRDFMGLRLAEVKRRPKPKSPCISFVMPMQDDRRGLWETLNSILNQRCGDYEVVCVDCSSSDRSYQITKDLSEVDGRFCALACDGSVADGCNIGLKHARGRYVLFLRPGVALDDRMFLNAITSGVNSFPQDVDLVIFRGGFPVSRIVPKKPIIKAVDLKVEAIEGDIALESFPTMYTRLFRRQFLLDSGIAFDDADDKDGYGICVKSICHARTAGFVAAREVRVDTRNTIDRDAIEDEQEMIEVTLKRYESFARAAEEEGTEVAWSVARSCIVCHMAIDIAKIGRHRSGHDYFEALRDVFENKYGIKATSQGDYVNFLDFGVVEEAFSSSYEEYAKKLLTKQNKSLIDLTWQKDVAIRYARKLEQSGSFLLGRRIGALAKAMVPEGAKNRFIVRSFESLENERRTKA